MGKMADDWSMEVLALKMAVFGQEANGIRGNNLRSRCQIHFCSLSKSSNKGAGVFNMVCLRLEPSLDWGLLLGKVTVSYSQGHMISFFLFLPPW